MPLEDVVQHILSCRPDLTEEEVLAMVEQKEKEAKGFLTRASAARSVAAEWLQNSELRVPQFLSSAGYR